MNRTLVLLLLLSQTIDIVYGELEDGEESAISSSESSQEAHREVSVEEVSVEEVEVNSHPVIQPDLSVVPDSNNSHPMVQPDLSVVPDSNESTEPSNSTPASSSSFIPIKCESRNQTSASEVSNTRLSDN